MNQVTDLAQAALSIAAGLPMRVSPLQAGQGLYEHCLLYTSRCV